MNSDAKQKWVAALRSGEFKQGTGALQEGDAFCCLGVACVVAEREGVKAERNGVNTLEGGDLSGAQRAVLEWLGGVCSEHEQELIDLNDTKCRDFDDIADYIETELP